MKGWASYQRGALEGVVWMRASMSHVDFKKCQYGMYICGPLTAGPEIACRL